MPAALGLLALALGAAGSIAYRAFSRAHAFRADSLA
jgi:Zn-dependent protease with chaperone function